jgi:hypothetical protein
MLKNICVSRGLSAAQDRAEMIFRPLNVAAWWRLDTGFGG